MYGRQNIVTGEMCSFVMISGIVGTLKTHGKIQEKKITAPPSSRGSENVFKMVSD